MDVDIDEMIFTMKFDILWNKRKRLNWFVKITHFFVLGFIPREAMLSIRDILLRTNFDFPLGEGARNKKVKKN